MADCNGLFSCKLYYKDDDWSTLDGELFNFDNLFLGDVCLVNYLLNYFSDDFLIN